MIALDTNVLVRYLARDDERQAESARASCRGGAVWSAAAVHL